MYTYIPISPPSCASLPPSLSHPSMWSQSSELISLCYAAAKKAHSDESHQPRRVIFPIQGFIREEKKCHSEKNKISVFYSFPALFIPGGNTFELPFLPLLCWSFLCNLYRRESPRTETPRAGGGDGCEAAVCPLLA